MMRKIDFKKTAALFQETYRFYDFKKPNTPFVEL